MADNYSDKYLTASEEIEKKRRQQGEEIAAAQERENQAYVAGMEAAQAANQAALNQSQQNYNNLMAKYDNDFAAMVQGESDRIRKEQEDARTMIQADQQAAKWTGLTELASSVANMIGVGSFNAVSQQYKPYSQDWMRKADQDMREHRYRLDNIRARQNALKQQQLQLRMGQAGDALAREQQRIDRDYANARELAGIRRDAALAPLQTRAQYDAQADQTRLQGVQGAAGLYNQEEGRRLQQASLGLQQQRLNDERENARLSRLASGFVEDENGQLKYDPDKAAQKLGVKSLTDIKSGSGKDKTDEFPVIDADGKVNNVKLTSEERQNMFTNAPAAIRRDLGEAQAKKFEQQLQMAVAQKDEKRVNEVYAEWIGKSPTMRNLLLEYDPNYKGRHGVPEEPETTATQGEGANSYEQQRDSFLAGLRRSRSK